MFRNLFIIFFSYPPLAVRSLLKICNCLKRTFSPYQFNRKLCSFSIIIFIYLKKCKRRFMVGKIAKVSHEFGLTSHSTEFYFYKVNLHFLVRENRSNIHLSCTCLLSSHHFHMFVWNTSQLIFKEELSLYVGRAMTNAQQETLCLFPKVPNFHEENVYVLMKGKPSSVEKQFLN